MAPGRLGDLVLGLGLRLGTVQRQQPFQLGGVEAEEIEIEPLVAQPADLLGQQLIVPARGGRELVVSDDVGPLLRFGEMLQPHHRHLGETKLPCRHQPAVASEDSVDLVDQDRVGEAELDHRGGELRHLILAVGARVALVGAQPLDRPQLDALRQRRQPGCRVGHRGSPDGRAPLAWVALVFTRRS